LTQFKGTSEHSELRLLNQQQRKVWCEGKPGLVVMGFGQDMKRKKEKVGNEFVMAYCVLQFIADVRKIISQLVCAECNKTSAFVTWHFVIENYIKTAPN